MTNNEAFFRFISPEHLYFIASIFGSITVLIVIMIYISLYRKKRRYFDKHNISDKLHEWISESLMAEEGDAPNIEPWLTQYMRKPRYRQFLTDSLIDIKKNISGAASENVIALYERLGLKKDSMDKFGSMLWHKKARGIYELYMMGQQDAKDDIARYTNNGNEIVRMEAQTATIGFNGFEGLSFLNTLTHPLNEWQQLKLLEQLHTLNPEEMHDLPRWLSSANDHVRLFALKLAEIYQEFGLHNRVAVCLRSPNENIRKQAVKTLGKIAGEHTALILREQYKEETDTNKLVILRQLCTIGSEEDVPFFTEQLEYKDDAIKLEAGRALKRFGATALLEERSAGDAVLLSIYKHIQFESTE